MELVWYGLSCFRITERGLATVVTDPFGEEVGLTPPKLKADILTISHHASGHSNSAIVTGPQHILQSPGEFEIGGVFVTGIPTFDKDRRNVIFIFGFDGLTIAHMGDLAKVPTQTQIEAMGSVNVLLLPVGGGNGLNAVQAAELVSLVEPNIVVPMHYKTNDLTLPLDSLERFLKEMGVTNPTEESSLKVSASGLSETTQLVVLTPR